MNHKSIQLALTLPGSLPIPNPSGLKSEFVDLGSFLSPFLNIVFYIVIFLAFYWLLWGAFQYILASGNKESLAKARSRITWALIGLVVVFSSFLIARYAANIFKPGIGGLPF